jgi:hypothetical protein
MKLEADTTTTRRGALPRSRVHCAWERAVMQLYDSVASSKSRHWRRELHCDAVATMSVNWSTTASCFSTVGRARVAEHLDLHS